MSTSWSPRATSRVAGRERRAFPRFPLAIPVHLHAGEVAWTACTVNVSACGILASASLTLPRLHPVELWFRFPGTSRVVALAGHVVRLGVPGADGEPCDRVALAFDRAAFADRESLAETLARSCSAASTQADDRPIHSPYPPTEIPLGISAPRDGRRNGAAPVPPLIPRRTARVLAQKHVISRALG